VDNVLKRRNLNRLPTFKEEKGIMSKITSSINSQEKEDHKQMER